MHSTLIPGQQVPDLSVPLVDGGKFTLNANAPENFTAIIFYRGLHCPICRGQLSDFNGKADDFAAIGIDVVAVSMDSEDRASRTRDDWRLDKLTLGYGMDEATARAWGLYMSDAIKDNEPAVFSEPGLAIVRPNGQLYHWSLQTAPFGRAKAADLAGVLKFVIENDYPVRGQRLAG
jgi:peroxiredoxin